MRRLTAVVFVAAALLICRPASAEYAWVTKARQAMAYSADRVGHCWNHCSEKCGAATRHCLRRAADWWSPEARRQTAARCGLRLPPKLDADGRLVVLVHGLDADAGYWCDLLPAMQAEGIAAAPFVYPNDQPIGASASLLAAELASLRRTHPRLKTDIVAHSMGAVLARAYVEGDEYTGGVGRLILLAPPNQGSCYSRFSVCCDALEHFHLWRTEPEWSLAWMAADGLGEARRDMAPGSAFLEELNKRGRRSGVRYTVIAGNRNCGWRYAGNLVRWSCVCVPGTQWGRAMTGQLREWADGIEDIGSDGDGVVPLSSAVLPGVNDLVIVPADHTTIACCRNGHAPVAWPIIKDRLVEPPGGTLPAR